MRAQPTYNEGIGAAIEDAMRQKSVGGGMGLVRLVGGWWGGWNKVVVGLEGSEEIERKRGEQ